MKRLTQAIATLLSLGISTIDCSNQFTRHNPNDPGAPAAYQNTATLTGTVYTTEQSATTATPLAGAIVTTSSSNNQLPPTATTDANGVFILSRLIPGTYRIGIVHPLHFEQWREITLLPGDNEFIDIVMQPDPDAESVGRLVGDVQRGDELGHPASEQNHQGILVSLANSDIRTVTNAQGHFECFAPSGRYDIVFSAPGYAPVTYTGIEVANQESRQVTEAPIVLWPDRGALSGHIFATSLATGTRAPAVGASVALNDHAMIHADQNGAFSITDLVPGSYSLTISQEGFEPVSQSDVRIRGGETTQLQDINLHPLRGGTLQGRILLAGENVHQGITVSVSGVTQVAVTDALGNFVMTDVPAGPHQVLARRDGFLQSNALMILISPDTITTLPDVTLLPWHGDFVINFGAQFTNRRQVTLRLNATDATLMRISESSSFRQADGTEISYIAYDPQPDWLLSSGDGPKTLHVQFQNRNHVSSGVQSASIVLDTTPPVVTQLAINHGAQFTNNAQGVVEIALQANDAQSGVKDLQISEDDIFSAPYVALTSQTLYQIPSFAIDGLKYVRVRVRDHADNVSTSPMVASIMLDRLAPTAPVINTDCHRTRLTSCNVSLTTPAQDINDIVYQLNGGQYSAWTPAANTAPWLFQLAGEGDYALSVRAVDSAGNISSPAIATVTRDTIAPSPPANLVTQLINNVGLRVTWNASESADVAGYRLFYGSVASSDKSVYTGSFLQNGVSPLDVGNVTQITLPLPQAWQTFYVAIEAYDIAGDDGVNRSALSPSKAITPPQSAGVAIQTLTGLGNASAINIAEQFLFITSSTLGVRIYDLADPHNLLLTGSLPRITWNRSVGVWGSYAYLTCSGTAGCIPGVRAIGLAGTASYESPSNAGVYDNGGTHRITHLVPTGRSAFAAYQDDGGAKIGRFEFGCAQSCPSINFLSETPLSNVATGFDATEHTAAALTDQGSVAVYNCEDPPAAPQLSWTLNASQLDNTPPRSIKIVEPYAFVGFANNGGLAILDLQNANNHLAGRATGFNCNNLAVAGDTVLCASGSSPAVSKLVAVDISNKQQPVLRRTLADATALAPVDLALYQNMAYLLSADNDRLESVEWLTPRRISQTGTYSNGTWNDIKTQGIYAYVTGDLGSEPLTILDISNPSSPQRVGRLPALNDSGSATLEIQGSFIYLASRNSNFVYAVDVSNPAIPRVIGNVNTRDPVQGLNLKGNILYAAHSNSLLQAWNIRRPNSMVLFSTAPAQSPSSISSALIRRGNNVYYIAQNNNQYALTIVQAQDANTMSMLASAPLPAVNTATVGMHLAGDFVFLGSGNAGLQIYDLTQNDNVRRLPYTNSGDVGALAGFGNILIGATAASGQNSLSLFNIRDPEQVTVITRENITITPKKIATLGRIIAVIAQEGGVYLYSLGD